MSSPVIKVENISKQYIIAHENPERYTALRDVIAKKAKKIFSFDQSMRPAQKKKSTEIFWALKDVSFELLEGDRVGIIGRNGAGKSTLLKILSRITEQTYGRITIHGRVASLLEVGTGFHPELTGRENIFLNGAILGMSRNEIRKKFDEIVDFAEIEKFLDTPVKRYSSGMYVRLAFAVAAHLEPEILVVDEVLAVGDAKFQKKCLNKMEDAGKKEGKTVLFVSHNMAAVKSLCNKAIVLHKGQKLFEGDVFESLAKYMAFDQSEFSHSASFARAIDPAKKIYIKEASLVDDLTKDFFCIELHLKIISSEQNKVGINLKLKDGMGFPVAFGCSHYFFPELHSINKGENLLQITTTRLPLATGRYKLSIEMVFPGIEQLDFLEDCIEFELSHDAAAKRNYGIAQEWGNGAMEIIFERLENN
ncbi:MAG TPA: ABC transporter ATP-binding protein [Puia sp.]|nr:ABC transporter ATP-binding protein [Puia sp.]